MKSFKPTLCAALLAIACATGPVFAHPPIAAKPTEQEQSKFDADRAAILAMAGTYKVKFDFQEQTSWQPDYTPIAPKVSGGYEVVRVIEDTRRKIILQHILVAEGEGKTFPIKHWRQDWEYEPATYLTYAGPNSWKLETPPERMRKGRWSQTVWQTDDSPRYGGFGEWEVQAGIPRWRSGWTWRPLARRDAVRKPVYDRYYAINRHSPAPGGWIHWQDNSKMGMKDGTLVPIVQEMTLNTYTKFDSFDAKRADDYWAKTKDYWAAVRAEWEAVIAKNGGITVAEEAQNGSVTGPKLMGLADDVENGKISIQDAVAEAKLVIAKATESDQ
jgi:hypothetical protein